jgi:HTH-type transcriptional regulator / antitoxin HigA
MDIRPIKTDQDHAQALREVEALMGAELGTQEGNRLEVLITLVEAWERRHHAVPLPDIQPSAGPAAA